MVEPRAVNESVIGSYLADRAHLADSSLDSMRRARTSNPPDPPVCR